MQEIALADTEIAPRRAHLTDSRPIDWDRVATSEAGQAAIDHLLARLEANEGRVRARRAADRERLRATLEAVVMDLFVAARTAAGRYLAYSRRSNDYSCRSRYRPPRITHRCVTRVTDFLIEASLADGTRGSYTRIDHGFGVAGRGYCSRLIATPALVELLEDRFGLRLADVGHRPDREVIVLKGPSPRRGASKPLVNYQDTPETADMRARLHQINSQLTASDIRLGEEGRRIVEERGLALDPGAKTLHRVFNNGSFEQGGRFYGGFWITLPKTARRHLLIDGRPVVELDFKALHPRLCYALAGIPLERGRDPYAIDGLPRPLVKKAFNQLLNASPGMRLRASAEAKALLPRGMSYVRVLERIERRHRPIAFWFRSGRGLELQRIDAMIAEGVMEQMVQACGIVVLPVHDSFIVKAQHEALLGQTMMLACRGVVSHLTGAPSWPVIDDWSDDEVRCAVERSLGL